MTDGTCGFQRARRPEQREARRQAILDTAAAMLAELPVTEISLRELSKRVGLAKSNVLRYFESREAVFLELLDAEGRAWLVELGDRLAKGEDVAAAIAESIAARPLVCELVSVTASVLERNISVEVARRFKLGTLETLTALAGLVRERLPGLSEDAAGRFASAVLVIVAGLWPFSHPTEPVLAAIEEALQVDALHLDFTATLRELLATQLAGALARCAAPDAAAR